MIFTRAMDFPKSDKYLREELPKVLKVPRIVNAMREFGGLSATAFANALKPSNPPTLVPSWVPVPASSTAPLFWIIPRDNSNRIFLKTSLFEDFEKQAGVHFLTTGNVSAPKGTPGAREFSGSYDKRGMLDQLSGSPTAGKQSLGLHQDKDMFLLGASILGALVSWSLWANQGKQDSNAATRFAVHAYRAIIY